MKKNIFTINYLTDILNAKKWVHTLFQGRHTLSDKIDSQENTLKSELVHFNVIANHVQN